MPRRLVLDTNLLMLLVVGDIDPNEIALHRRLQGYSINDYNLLVEFTNRFLHTVTFPNIVAEASNLIRQCPLHKRQKLTAGLAAFVQGATEDYHSSRTTTLNPYYLRLGLTDAVILSALTAEDHFLTVDLDLYIAALGAGCVAENFNHLRENQLINRY